MSHHVEPPASRDADVANAGKADVVWHQFHALTCSDLTSTIATDDALILLLKPQQQSWEKQNPSNRTIALAQEMVGRNITRLVYWTKEVDCLLARTLQVRKEENWIDMSARLNRAFDARKRARTTLCSVLTKPRRDS